MAESESVKADIIYDRERVLDRIDVTENKDGGILKEILKPGTGDETPSQGDKVKVHYVGMLEDGTEFDSSRTKGEEFTFDLGRGKVIQGWDMGIATMKKGEVAKFTIRPEYGYGRSGSPPKIPGNAVLIFEVELIDWHGEDLTDTEDGGIIRHIIEKARAWDSPNEGATVEIHIIGKHNGHVFEDRDVRFVMGEGVDQKLLPAIENSVKRFRRNEKSRLVIQPKYGYGETGNPELNIPPNAVLTYIVHLKSFEKAKDTWELDDNEKVEQAYIFKDKGTKYFKEENFKQAEKFYEKIVNLLEYTTSLSEENKPKRDSLLLTAHLNLAMTYIKMENFASCETQCGKALKLDPNSEKAFFRQGIAYFHMNKPEEARTNFENALKTDPENKATRNWIVKCNQEIKKAADITKKLYASMMSDLGKGLEDKKVGGSKKGTHENKISGKENKKLEKAIDEMD
ncbi:hypothetical protein CHS0354_009218 [Potamilus streckersoni]|uniref:peptidylprolyl isomerase n=1 Tax=Potamilus streckersoni TaxID=2493646 RepID=A0AAE0SZ06_9BIVA|nr:hypothetical protein CHS0354_009218 [Potamilus streckersoni]